MATRAGVVGSMVIDVDGTQLDATMIAPFGVVRDRFRLTQSGTDVSSASPRTMRGWMLLLVSTLAVGIALQRRRPAGIRR